MTSFVVVGNGDCHRYDEQRRLNRTHLSKDFCDGKVGPVLENPAQIAYAVEDVHRAARRWTNRGIGPFFVREHIDVVDVRVRGLPSTFDHSSAYAWWGSVMVELICQHDGGTAPLVPTGGLHHVAHFVDDVAVMGAALVAGGNAEVLYARTPTGVAFSMHDTRAELGHYVEIYEPTPPLRAFYEMVRTAAQEWSGDDPIRVL